MKKKGAKVFYHDPYIGHIEHEHEGWEMESVPDVMACVRTADAVVIVTNHTFYDYNAILAEAQFIFDSRNALGRIARDHPKVVRL